MDSTYQPAAVEENAQKFWQQKNSYSVTEDLAKEKFYCLSMFPYPSGTLHMGHVRNYTLGDVIARYHRALGKNVLQPIGWDAFGLPAENAAIKHNVHPADWTEKNIEKMKAQLLRLGNAYDWKRELATCDPSYYCWEQWFFIKLYEKGLVYKKNATVNWDPVDKTVLANEQVVDGRGWRSGALIEQKEISQWFVKITAYADELLESLNELEGWPHQVKSMQKNWIGKSNGTEISFTIKDQAATLKIFTTRADTLMGVSYLAIASDHPLAKQAANDNEDIAAFIKTCQQIKVSEAELATLDKKGIATPFYAEHPITGETLPVWVANFVLMNYGEGAVMCVPAHDERDHDFACQYHLPIKPVINAEHDYNASAFTDKGNLINSLEFNELSSDEAIKAITIKLTALNKGKETTHYRLRDWGVSRQRYWGTPIPMINCDSCGHIPVKEDDLPVILPKDVDFSSQGSPLTTNKEFLEVECPKCGTHANRETDTFDTFFESSWYYARFACKNQDNAMLDDRAKYWTPVDQYVGGIEHAVMHLLYARFFHKLMRDFGLVNSDEPFKKLLTQGMVLKDGTKMSKSKGNIVDPNEIIDKYGADTARFFSMFAAPPEQSLEWSDSGVEGAYRFLKKLWQFCHDNLFIKEVNEDLENSKIPQTDWIDASTSVKKLRCEVHQVLSQILFDYERCQFNTVASGVMKIFNLLSSTNKNESHYQKFVYETIKIILQVLAPLTPHICHELWQNLSFKGEISQEKWPKVAKDALKLDVITYVVQINGKLKGQVDVDASADNDEIIKQIKANKGIEQTLDGKVIRKEIVVNHRQLVNFVVT